MIAMTIQTRRPSGHARARVPWTRGRACGRVARSARARSCVTVVASVSRDGRDGRRERAGASGRDGASGTTRAGRERRGESAATLGAFQRPMAMPTALVKETTEGPIELATDEHRVLVLDVGYRTIDIVSWQRAVVLQMMMKVEVVAYYDGPWALSAAEAYYVPAVVRTREYSRHDAHTTQLISLHRRNIFIRDGFRCQYCGKGNDLTVDHVVPASKGGPWSWENLTTACARCNNKKGDKSLAQSGMRLRSEPKAPTVANMCLFSRNGRFVNPPEEWIPFIPVHQIVQTHEQRDKLAGLDSSIARCR